MRLFSDLNKASINKKRTCLLLLVDEELKKKQNNDFKINSKSEKELCGENNEFFIYEQTLFNPCFSQSRSQNSLVEKKKDTFLINPFPRFDNASLTSKNVIIEKDVSYRNPAVLNKTMILETLKDNHSSCYQAYQKLKSIAEKLKRLTINFGHNSFSNHTSYRPNINNLKIPNNVKRKSNTNNFFKESSRKCENKVPTTSIKPSYDLITSELTNDFLNKLRNSLKKDRTNTMELDMNSCTSTRNRNSDGDNLIPQGKMLLGIPKLQKLQLSNASSLTKSNAHDCTESGNCKLEL